MQSSSAASPLGSRDPAQIRAELERTRAELSRTVATLSAEVAARTDWREWARLRPLLAVGGAFALGFWLGDHR